MGFVQVMVFFALTAAAAMGQATSFVEVRRDDETSGLHGQGSGYSLYIDHGHPGYHHQGYAQAYQNHVPASSFDYGFGAHDIPDEANEIPSEPYVHNYVHNSKGEHVPILTEAGVPVDTPEVQIEKQRHFKAHALAEARELGVAHLAGTYAAGHGYENPSSYDVGYEGVPEEEAERPYPDYSPYSYASSYDHQRHWAGEQHIPIITDAGVPLDTPEVQIARARHFTAHAIADARAHGFHYPIGTYASRYDYGHNPHEHVPIMTDAGVPVDTPEVQIAKIQHHNAHIVAEEREARAEAHDRLEDHDHGDESVGEEHHDFPEQYASGYQHEIAALEDNHPSQGEALISNDLGLGGVYEKTQPEVYAYGYQHQPQIAGEAPISEEKFQELLEQFRLRELLEKQKQPLELLQGERLQEPFELLQREKLREKLEEPLDILQRQGPVQFLDQSPENYPLPSQDLALEQPQREALSNQGYPLIRYQQKFVIPTSLENPQGVYQYVLLQPGYQQQQEFYKKK